MVATDDGTAGKHGYVTQLIDSKDYDQIYCCGPEIMMKKVLDKVQPENPNSAFIAISNADSGFAGHAVWTAEGM